MTDPQISTMLHELTDELVPDVRRLVDGGVDRGRRRVRRRAIASASAVAAVAASVVVGVVVGDAGAGGRALDPDVATTPTPPASTRPAGTIPPAREMAVEPSQIVATFVSLVGGTPTEDPQKESGIPNIDFHWNGFDAKIGFASPEVQAGWAADGTRNPVVPRTAMERCVEERAPDGTADCKPGVNGSVVVAHTYRLRNSAEVTNSVDVYTADGWMVFAIISNVRDKEGGDVIADEPPLSLAELVAVAQDDVWFHQGPSSS